MLTRSDFLPVACLFSSLIGTSCVVGPDFKLPEMQLTARWKEWVASDSFKAKMAAKEPAERGGEDIPECDD
jgi:hypothetical protein